MFRRGIGEGSDVVGKEMYEFEDRGGRPWPCGPRAPPPWSGPSSSTARRCRGRPGTPPRPSATSGPRPAGTASTTSWAWRPSAPTDPDLDVEVIALADGFYRALGLADVRASGSTPWATTTCRPGLPGAAARLPRRAPATSCAPSTASAARPTRSGSSTASGRPAGRPPPDAPALVDHLCDPCRGPLRPGAGPASTRLGVPYTLDHRLVRGFDYYTRTTFEFSSERPRRRPERHRRRRALRRPGRDAGRAPHPGHRLRHRHRAAPAGLRRRGGVPGRPAARSTPSWST